MLYCILVQDAVDSPMSLRSKSHQSLKDKQQPKSSDHVPHMGWVATVPSMELLPGQHYLGKT